MLILRLLISSSLALLSASQGTTCLKHEHCPDNSVCVTEAATASPRCRCLVGYRDSGKDCVENSAGNLAEAASAVLAAQPAKIVVEKCSPPNAKPAAAAKLRPSQPEKAREKGIGGGGEESESKGESSGEVEAKTLKVPCSPVECDFSSGPCNYQNDYYSEWQLREIEGGTILLSSGDAKTEHYLLSSPFRVREPSLLLFDYFESSLGPSHLSVYSRDLATLVWKPGGKEAGWQQAVATLAPGKHQIIFAAEKLKPSELAAVTNIRLVGATGSPAGCF